MAFRAEFANLLELCRAAVLEHLSQFVKLERSKEDLGVEIEAEAVREFSDLDEWVRAEQVHLQYSVTVECMSCSIS